MNHRKLFTLLCTVIGLVIPVCINLSRTWSMQSGINHVSTNARALITFLSGQKPFTWEELDVSIPSICGADKCFFRSLHDGQIGYLVSRNTREEQGYERQVHEGWELSRYLQAKFEIQHFLLGSPMLLNVTESDAALLNSNLRSSHKRKTIPPNSIYSSEHLAVVQRVRVAPEPFMIIKANLSWEDAWKTMDKWLENVVQNRTSFARQLEIHLQSTLEILMAVPLFYQDFQIMIDSEGNLFQFDFDRIFVGIFERNFEEKFRLKHAKTTRTVRVLILWARSQYSEEPSSAQQMESSLPRNDSFDYLLTANSDEADEAETEALMMRYNNTSGQLACDAIQEYVENNFRWRDLKMNDLARQMMIDYVQGTVNEGQHETDPRMHKCMANE